MNDNKMNLIDIENTSPEIPKEIPILPLRDMVAYPHVSIPLLVAPQSVGLIDDAIGEDRLIGLVSIKSSESADPGPGELFETGTVAKLVHINRKTDGTMMVVMHGLKRFRVTAWTEKEPYLKARIAELSDERNEDESIEINALESSLRDLAMEVAALSPTIPKEAAEMISQIKDPLHLAYMLAANIEIELTERQHILETDDANEMMRRMIGYLSRERDKLNIKKKIHSEARETMDKTQREFYLRQQLKAIQKELGEPEAGASEADVYAERIEASEMTEEAKKEARREADRLAKMSPHSPEHPTIKTYLDWLLDLPWGKSSEEEIDITQARKVLDDDHYGLHDIKDRLIEHLAVRKRLQARSQNENEDNKTENSEPDAMGVILCFAGPPGVGKTSLGQSIARAMGREFTRMSLGGVRDESEIRGHRRTYVGAMPGRIIQALKRAGTRNPVFMLDEIDKIGSDWRGDPSSALLEVLDPAQNGTYRDHYLDVDFDLSDVVFIATANQLDTIPGPLRDRMEIIQLDGYTEFEKIQIAVQHLIPRQLKAHGINEDEITFMDEAIRKVIGDYTREAGVRNLERQIAAVCRKSIVKIEGEEWSHVMVTPELVREYLKKEKFESELSETMQMPGIVTGLAVTQVGGDILFIEATRMDGKGRLTVTGQLGEVMKESAQIAHSYVRSKAREIGIDSGEFERTDVHLHVPAGAIPKDGPSAGVAMVMALTSLFTGRPVRNDIGMTGEITLRGRVMPVGGVKMKVLAAHRAGLKTVILPKRNSQDLDELPLEVRESMTFVLTDQIDEAIETVFTPEVKETSDSKIPNYVVGASVPIPVRHHRSFLQ